MSAGFSLIKGFEKSGHAGTKVGEALPAKYQHLLNQTIHRDTGKFVSLNQLNPEHLHKLACIFSHTPLFLDVVNCLTYDRDAIFPLEDAVIGLRALLVKINEGLDDLPKEMQSLMQGYRSVKFLAEKRFSLTDLIRATRWIVQAHDYQTGVAGAYDLLELLYWFHCLYVTEEITVGGRPQPKASEMAELEKQPLRFGMQPPAVAMQDGEDGGEGEDGASGSSWGRFFSKSAAKK